MSTVNSPTLAADAPLSTWLAHLEALHPKGQAGIELGLERVYTMQTRLGQGKFCPIFMVAGTNGKGSTCAYLENILRHAGYRTGCYTSPHLTRYNERVRINGEQASDAALTAAFAKVEAARGDLALTYFEFGTLAAWEVFAAAEVEALILEIGLGGRLDAVNAYEPDISLITSIDLDHKAWLGETREAIGREKAGIFRAGKPALCADPNPPSSLVAYAQEIGANLRVLGQDFGFDRSQENRMQWRFWSMQKTIDAKSIENKSITKRSMAYPGLRGSTQLLNASLVLTALETMENLLPVSMQAIREGLIQTELPGRFQVIPGRPSVVLDVGHNPQAIRVLDDNLGNMGFFNQSYAVVGMLADKDIAASLLPLKDKFSHWFCVSLPGVRGTTAEMLAEIIRAMQPQASISCHDSPEAAFAAAQEKAEESDRIVAFGSFLTVAGVLQTLGRG